MSSDFELLDAWRGGDKAAGNALVRRHFDALFRFFELKVPRHAKDLTQKSVLACVAARDDFREDASFKAYLFGIARNQLLVHFRSHYRAGKVFSPSEVTIDRLAGGDASPTGVIAEHEQQRLLLAALRRIPIDSQIAIELFYWEELSVSDVARVLDVPLGTVKSRLSRAREQLRLQIDKLAQTEDLRRSTADNLDRWASSLRIRAVGDDPERA
ncbi:MAG: sigma-70 family RNA polymerase sigma factor [Myxococcota bacterium]